MTTKMTEKLKCETPIELSRGTRQECYDNKSDKKT